MDYHLDKEIRINVNSEYKSLYSWSLQEFNKEGEAVGFDQVPWPWSLHFSASELRLHSAFDINKYNNEDKGEQEECETISAILHPGFCRDGETLEGDVFYSMFGTNRKINEFSLRINKIQNGSKDEKSKIWGCVSYTAECDFRDVTTEDCIEIFVSLTPERFNRVVGMIKSQRVDLLRLRLSGVCGFYSEWSPSITTRSIKVLADSDAQPLLKEKNCKLEPLRLGDVGEFSLNITQRQKLNFKQDLRGVNVDKLFDDVEESADDVMNSEVRQESQQDKILSQLLRNESALKQIRFVLWLILIVIFIYIY